MSAILILYILFSFTVKAPNWMRKSVVQSNRVFLLESSKSNTEVYSDSALVYMSVNSAPWFCSFRLWRFINHLLIYLLTTGPMLSCICGYRHSFNTPECWEQCYVTTTASVHTAAEIVAFQLFMMNSGTIFIHRCCCCLFCVFCSCVSVQCRECKLLQTLIEKPW